MSDEVLNFGEAMKRLESIVQQLEQGGKGLEETIQLFEEGAALLKKCQQELNSVEDRVNELSLDEAEQLGDSE